MKINNVEIQDLDIFDADVAEKYESELKAVTDFTEEINTENKEGKLKNSEYIRKVCTMINNFIDTLWGEGTAYKVFNGRCNMVVSMNAFAEIIDWVNDEKNHKDDFMEVNKIVNKYANRAERRRKDKGKS